MSDSSDEKEWDVVSKDDIEEAKRSGFHGTSDSVTDSEEKPRDLDIHGTTSRANVTTDESKDSNIRAASESKSKGLDTTSSDPDDSSDFTRDEIEEAKRSHLHHSSATAQLNIPLVQVSKNWSWSTGYTECVKRQPSDENGLN